MTIYSSHPAKQQCHSVKEKDNITTITSDTNPRWCIWVGTCSGGNKNTQNVLIKVLKFVLVKPSYKALYVVALNLIVS